MFPPCSTDVVRRPPAKCLVFAGGRQRLARLALTSRNTSWPPTWFARDLFRGRHRDRPHQSANATHCVARCLLRTAAYGSMSSAGELKRDKKPRNQGRNVDAAVARIGQRLTPSETSAPPVGIGRRRVVQAAVGSALLTMPTLRRAAAQSQPLRIGVLTDMSSWGRDNGGPGSIHAANAAAKEFKGEVAGRKVEIVVGDHKMSPDVGMTIARSWFDEGGVEAIADVPNSAIALAVSGLCKDKNRIALLSAPGSSELTNARCNDRTVQFTYNSYATTKVTTSALMAEGAKTGSSSLLTTLSASSYKRMQRISLNKAAVRCWAARCILLETRIFLRCCSRPNLPERTCSRSPIPARTARIR